MDGADTPPPTVMGGGAMYQRRRWKGRGGGGALREFRDEQIVRGPLRFVIRNKNIYVCTYIQTKFILYISLNIVQLVLIPSNYIYRHRLSADECLEHRWIVPSEMGVRERERAQHHAFKLRRLLRVRQRQNIMAEREEPPPPTRPLSPPSMLAAPRRSGVKSPTPPSIVVGE